MSGPGPLAAAEVAMTPEFLADFAALCAGVRDAAAEQAGQRDGVARSWFGGLAAGAASALVYARLAGKKMSQ